MPFQEEFHVERFMDAYESDITYNLAETCCYSLSIEEISKLADVDISSLSQKILSERLTYGSIQGTPQLKSAIEQLYQSVSPEIVVTNGAIGANYLVAYGVVEKDDHVVVVDPHYQLLSSVPKMFGANVDLFPLRFEDKYQPNLKLLDEMVTPKTKLLVINNPNNPTGAVWSNDVLEKIIEICKKNDVIIQSDEVYRPLFHIENSEKPKLILEFGYKKAISTLSMSKAFALAGLRLGWVATLDEDLFKIFCSRRDYNTISVSKIDDLLATFALNHRDAILKRNHDLCAKNLQILEKFIADSDGLFEWVRPKGGSTCFIKVDVDDVEKLCQDMATKFKVLIVPGTVFGYEGFIRVGFGNSTEELESGLPILLKYTKSLNRRTEAK